MGGYGSGRTYHSGAKATTDQYRSIDIRRWKREGLLQPGTLFTLTWTRRYRAPLTLPVSVEPGRFVLRIFRARGFEELEGRPYSIHLDWTDCALGGQRPWFRCPAIGCGRRAAILYGGAIFACRQCYGLVYRTQREAPHYRAITKADKIRKKLGWCPGIAHGEGWKPKGMHWKTYSKLVNAHNEAVHISTLGVIKQFNLMERMLERIGKK